MVLFVLTFEPVHKTNRMTIYFAIYQVSQFLYVLLVFISLLFVGLDRAQETIRTRTSTNARHTHAQNLSSTNQTISARAYVWHLCLCLYLSYSSGQNHFLEINLKLAEKTNIPLNLSKDVGQNV